MKINDQEIFMSTSTKKISYPFFDCDNHFYEPQEALMRHMPKRFESLFKYVNINGRTKLILDGKLSDYIPNPTFEVVAAPGCHVDYYRGKNPDGKSMRELSVIEKSKPEYQYKTAARYDLLKEQGLIGTLVFPTLASVIEGHMGHRPDFCHAAFHSLNMWIKEEWGFGDDNVFYATPVITLMEVEKAMEEAEWIINQGSKVVLIRPSYVPGWRGNRGMGSMEFEPVFARLEEAGIFIAFHSSDNGYQDVFERHASSNVNGEYQPFNNVDPLSLVLDVNQRAHADHLASLICHGVFDRHPKLKVGYIETGTSWIYPLWERLEHVNKMAPQLFKRHPHEVIREHVWLHPHFEEMEAEKAHRLIDLVGADHVLFGSDWPHPEGLAQPAEWIQFIHYLNDVDKAKIMGGNMLGLLGRAA